MSGQVEVRKYSCRQDKDGQWIVSFQFHPDDIYNDLVLAKKDTVFNLTYELAESEGTRDGSSPDYPGPEKPVAPSGQVGSSRPAPSDYRFNSGMPDAYTKELAKPNALLKDMGKSLVQRAAMLCRDKAFKIWITNGLELTDEAARAHLAEELGLHSLSELAYYNPAQQRFLELVRQYEEERGGGLI